MDATIANYTATLANQNNRTVSVFLFNSYQKRTMCEDSADTIKATVIDWLLERHKDILIGNEVMYGSKRKVVDLLAIINGKTVAIEIKSALDKLVRLPEQLEEYSRVFDRTIIISSPSHISSIKRQIGYGVGLYEINKSIKRRIASSLNHCQDKTEMLYSISATYLKKAYPQYKGLNEKEIRLVLSKKSKTEIHRLLVSFYKSRFSERFELFLRDRGEYTLLDDIPTLSSLIIIG